MGIYLNLYLRNSEPPLFPFIPTREGTLPAQ